MKTLKIFRSMAAAALVLPMLALAGQVDINSADAKTLARELDGIGLARAQAIVEYREKNGAFKSAADLAKVKGIPMKVVERNRDNIQLGHGRRGAPDKSDKAAAADSTDK